MFAKFQKKMYPVLYGQLVCDSTETSDIEAYIKSLNRLIAKLNDKLIFSDQNPYVLEVDNEIKVSEGIHLEYFN